tara:strand:- start:103 stop:396 length:294 start_codon:yes stop_codon:yes gene_type:complete
MLTVSSFSVFAGADPDEIVMENTETSQAIVKKDEAETELATKETVKEVMQEVVTISDNCVSFPEAVAFKEHFACHSDIEKLRLARLDWSFAKLIIRD